MSENPFDYINSITYTKKNMMADTDNDPLAEKQYNAFLTNRGLSYFYDTIIYANEMNRYSFLDKKLQYSFLINIIRPKKRFSKWSKKIKNSDLDLVKEYFQYNDKRAIEALSLLSNDDLRIIKTKIEKGG
jgi:hypothetical protein